MTQLIHKNGDVIHYQAVRNHVGPKIRHKIFTLDYHVTRSGSQ